MGPSIKRKKYGKKYGKWVFPVKYNKTSIQDKYLKLFLSPLCCESFMQMFYLFTPPHSPPRHCKPLFPVRLRALSRNLMVWNSDSLLGTLTPFFFFCFLCANSFQTRQVNEIVRSDLRQWSKDKATTRGRIKAKCNSCLVFSLAHSVAQVSSLPCPDTSVGGGLQL